MTAKERVWQQYYAAVKSGNKQLAERLLKKLHEPPAGPAKSNARRAGGCSRCRKRMG